MSCDAQVLASIETMRCKVMCIGGEQPCVYLVSRSEERAFSLVLNCELAKKLAAYLYRDVDLDIKVRRCSAGSILSGTVESFKPVDEKGEPLDALREWFAPHKAYWDKVGDIEHDLDRHRPR